MLWICANCTIFALAKGKMQEWLNWPAWKASKPQKGFGGSNPPLSAKQTKQRDVEQSTSFCFSMLRHKLVCRAWRRKTKVVDLSTLCVVVLQGAPRRVRGKTSSALRYEVNPPLSAKNRTKQGDVDIIGIFLFLQHYAHKLVCRA